MSRRLSARRDRGEQVAPRAQQSALRQGNGVTTVHLAASLGKREGEQIRLFLLGDAASCANRGQEMPTGYYGIESMVTVVIRQRGDVVVCGSCVDARGISERNLVEGCHRSSMEGLTEWTQWADPVVTF